ncbi:S-layer homology domain-containing protein [Paenibacillus sp. YPG26]|uniref:S-layer homology domain-containing protein n=1 Tax=Paenibacillus sp. YPG26 TaxID=2878915 RepID=UPI00203EA10B|nr:S-layer homology domain-containing protein [Paenibacillus sp. YPG26]USB31850.1 S-layer homology domain-containing protein [Paenibacillus sp. YPG26]
MKKKYSILLLSTVLLLGAAMPVHALQNTTSDMAANRINVIPIPGNHLDPQQKLDYASGITSIVKGFDLNLSNYRFIKMPVASDYFDNISNSAWYSEAFVIAKVRGLDIPKDITSDTPMTREQFAHLLAQAIQLQGDFPVVARYNTITDSSTLKPEYDGSVQLLINLGIPLLDTKLNFYPKSPVTRSVAAGWLNTSMEVIGDMQAQLDGRPLQAYSVSTKLVDEKITEVQVHAQAPHAGYGIRISSIEFDEEQAVAVIYTEVLRPDPNRVYAQVITQVQDTAYIPAGYKIRLAVAKASLNNSPAARSENISR